MIVTISHDSHWFINNRKIKVGYPTAKPCDKALAGIVRTASIGRFIFSKLSPSMKWQQPLFKPYSWGILMIHEMAIPVPLKLYKFTNSQRAFWKVSARRPGDSGTLQIHTSWSDARVWPRWWLSWVMSGFVDLRAGIYPAESTNQLLIHPKNSRCSAISHHAPTIYRFHQPFTLINRDSTHY